jgi:hypothetical protein
LEEVKSGVSCALDFTSFLGRSMLYKFKSKATSDLIMLGPDAQRLLRLMGSDGAPKGIFTVEHQPQAIAALEASIAQDEARIADLLAERISEGADDSGAATTETVSLKRRAQPMLEMLRRSVAAKADVVWGV